MADKQLTLEEMLNKMICWEDFDTYIVIGTDDDHFTIATHHDSSEVLTIGKTVEEAVRKLYNSRVAQGWYDDSE